MNSREKRAGPVKAEEAEAVLEKYSCSDLLQLPRDKTWFALLPPALPPSSCSACFLIYIFYYCAIFCLIWRCWVVLGLSRALEGRSRARPFSSILAFFSLIVRLLFEGLTFAASGSMLSSLRPTTLPRLASSWYSHLFHSTPPNPASFLLLSCNDFL